MTDENLIKAEDDTERGSHRDAAMRIWQAVAPVSDVGTAPNVFKRTSGWVVMVAIEGKVYCLDVIDIKMKTPSFVSDLENVWLVGQSGFYGHGSEDPIGPIRAVMNGVVESWQNDLAVLERHFSAPVTRDDADEMFANDPA